MFFPIGGVVQEQQKWGRRLYGITRSKLPILTSTLLYARREEVYKTKTSSILVMDLSFF